MQLVFGVAQIDAVNIVGNAALDHIKVGRGDFRMLRRPRPVEIGMVARLQRCFHRRQFINAHFFLLWAISLCRMSPLAQEAELMAGVAVLPERL